MSTFKKEQRYVVFKRSDLGYAVRKGFLTETSEGHLKELIAKVAEAHQARTKGPDLKCVVVEHDWDIYDSVWQLVELEHERNKLRKQVVERETPTLRVCASCTHARVRSDVSATDGIYVCARNHVLENANIERQSESGCGIAAKYWQERK